MIGVWIHHKTNLGPNQKSETTKKMSGIKFLAAVSSLNYTNKKEAREKRRAKDGQKNQETKKVKPTLQFNILLPDEVLAQKLSHFMVCSCKAF